MSLSQASAPARGAELGARVLWWATIDFAHGTLSLRTVALAARIPSLGLHCVRLQWGLVFSSLASGEVFPSPLARGSV